MKKHGVIMVFLLILALCLMGTVSANENVTVDCDYTQLSFNQEDIQVEIEESQIAENEYELDEFSGINQKDYSIEGIQNLNIENDENQINISMQMNNLPEINFEQEIDTQINAPMQMQDLPEANFELTKINDKTTENVLNKINASNRYVTYNNGNLLMLPLIERNLNIENKESLMITFENGTEEIQLSGNYDLKSADLWKDSLITGLSSNDITLKKKSYYTGFICNQTNSYPQNDLPLENTEILGVSRDSDKNAFAWLENSGESASVFVDMVNNTPEKVLDLNLNDNDLNASIRQIGIDASLKALNYFKSRGIDIPKGYPYLYVLTSAGEVEINGLSTYEAIYGISEMLGLELNKNIFQIHDSSLKDLIFIYIWKNSKNSKDTVTYALKYDLKTNKLVEIFKNHKISPFVPKMKYGSVDELLNINSTNNNTNITNSSGNASVFNRVVEDSISFIGEPNNLLYTLGAIVILSVFFGASYTKRN
ncbi:hypothetical protein [Methanobrevibacter sp.]|uniref:hypothetical protein n=1 Tax=Methanobrevibacter sp. TaxID=66852 RepID=UPI00388DD3B0